MKKISFYLGALIFLSFNAVQARVRCSQSKALTDNEIVTIESPGYDAEKSRHYCSRYNLQYSAGSGRTMTITCSDIDIECSPRKDNSYNNYFSVNSDKMCGDSFPQTTTTDNILKIQYRSRNNKMYYRYPHRMLTFKFKCEIKVNVPGASSPPSAPPSVPSSPSSPSLPASPSSPSSPSLPSSPSQPHRPAAPPAPSTAVSDIPCDCGTRKNGFSKRIVGGEETLEGEFPYHVSLVTYSKKLFCGGSLISNQWVISAAHCRVLPYEFVRLGDHNKEDTSQNEVLVKISKVHVHPEYDRTTRTHRYDVVLVKMAKSVAYTDYIRPICLPDNFQPGSFQGKKLTATGWGHTQHGGEQSAILLKVDLDVISNDECTSKGGSYARKIFPQSMCTLTPGKDTCKYDSGGPLAYNKEGRFYLAGVTSWGPTICAHTDKPAVYVRLADDGIMKWIRQTAGIQCKTP